MSRRGPLDPNAAKALNKMRLEIADELGVTDNITEDKNDSLVYEQVKIGGKIGGNMTRRLVEMGQNQLINKK
ncbi:alpha/beta-type small acid-soluble spore protein [Alkaliphilus sp. MSJ-5]|uniref:Alpha/beta-type small acid-soluble spore protein n=1 Tax=Alkaliphilus flagellatus TaxID=2841507 RepID=A0ABS6G8P8_9FIRM|nr:alpha/beta-type small acid-soluble spore protein [Alkaliphilus flagellatus]MBU5677968.1 alpha/beta-type small acid-soluble spore protein [Alkaliphilus flagellatus]